MTNLDQEEIDKRLEKLGRSWFESGDGQLTTSYDFKDFSSAKNFVMGLAEISEKLDHHPAISWQYKTVVISLITHETEGLTAKDFELAEQAQKLAEKI